MRVRGPLLVVSSSLVVVSCASAPVERDLAAPLKATEAPAAHQSSFTGYKGFREQPIAPWAASNDLVHRLGGWKAFAADKVPDIKPGPEDEEAPAK